MRRLFAVVVGLGLVGILATSASAAPTFRATASMTPRVQYLNDTTGTVFTFNVINLGDTRFAAVDIARPSPSWTVTACPKAPAGWTAVRHVWGCRFTSRVTAADDIPGHSSNANFRVKAKVRAGTDDLVGRWRVVVSRTRSFALARDLRSAPPLTPGLRMVAHSFQVTDAVLTSSPLPVGSACPPRTAANHSAITGSTGHTVVICGRNRTTAARTPVAAHSSLGGSFIASHGGFTSGRIRANSGNVVLGNWANVTITSTSGAGHSVTARIGSNPVRTSPLTVLSGYVAINQAPVAAAASAATNEDVPSGPITLIASDSDGDTVTFSIVSGPAHGVLGAISPGACPSTAPAAHTCTATVVYTPAANYHGPDSFTYRATDSFGAASAPATVSLTVNSVNDAPVVNPATFSLPENSSNGTAVGTATASDVDTGQTRIFSIQGGNTGGAFAISASSGAITVANSAALDFESTPSFALIVRATDNGSPAAFGQATVTVNLTDANDAPTVTTTGGSTAYTENAAAVAIDGGLTVGDADDTNLESGRVRISSNFQAGDNLIFVDQAGISGVYDTGTGVLTLTGTSSPANYQTALRSVKFSSTNDDPSASRTVAFRVNDGSLNSAEGTRTIAITPVNDAPTVATTSGSSSFTENGGAVTIDGGLTVSDPDSSLEGARVRVIDFATGDLLAFTNQLGINGVYNLGTGVLTLSGTASAANYQTALRSIQYDSSSQDPPSGKSIGFIVNDGTVDSAEATKAIAITSVNDAPVVGTSAGATPYTEGASAVSIDGSLIVGDADDTNIESGVVRVSNNFQSGDDLIFVDQNGISGVYNTGTGVLTLNGTASKADYQTALRSITFRNVTNDDPTASKTIEFKVNDGTSDSAAATKGITVTAVNDAPSVNSIPAQAAIPEDSGQQTVNLAGITSGGEASQTLTVTAESSDTGLIPHPTVTYTSADTTGSLSYTPVANQSGTANITVTVRDDGGTANGGVDTISRIFLVTVTAVNDAPVVTTSAGSAAYTEDGPAVTIDGSLTVTDIDDTDIDSGQVRISANFQSGDDLVFVNTATISGTYNTGTGVLTLTGTASKADYQTALRSIQFRTTNGDPAASKTVEFKVNDGDSDSAPATKNIAVTVANDDPTVVTSAGSASYTEDGPAVAIDPALTVGDPDSTELQGASVSISANFSSVDGDTLNFVNQSGITGSYATATGVLTLSGTATLANYQTALRSVTFSNTSDNPSTLARTVTFSVTDGSGTDSDTKGLTVAAVDDPPTAVNDSATVLEDAAATPVDVLANDTDVDAGPKTIASGSDPANGTVVLTGGSPGAHTGLTYQPDPNYCNDPPGTTPDTFTYTLNGGSTATVSVTVTCVNDAPIADDETFSGADSAVGNTTFIVNDPDDAAPSPTGPKKVVAGDILAGDSDPDGPAPIVLTAGTFSTNDGGSVTLEADGDFTFQPAAATSCTDTSDFFDYTISDSHSPSASDTGRVTISISGCVWYVKNDALGTNSGTSVAPFLTLAQAETASGAGHTVFVYDGDDTSTGYNTGYAMNANERLIGESEGLVVGSDTLLAANAGATPSLTATNEDVIDLDDGNEVRDFNIDPNGTGGGIAGSSGDTGGGTIDDVHILDTGTAGDEPGLELNGTTGTFNISDLEIDNAARGVHLVNAGTVNFLGTGTISINTAGARGLHVFGTGLGTSTFDDITVTGSGDGGVWLENSSGTTIFSDLELTTTSGTSAALRISSGGTVSVPGSTSNISATGGPAIDVNGTTITTLSFDDVDSTNSAATGISLSGLGAGTFSANSGDISGAAGTAFSVSGGSGTITYPGNLANGSGATASITNRTGGTVTLGGAITDSSDAGGGITVSSNSGGSTVISNGTKTLSTGAGIAVLFNGGDGHTLTLSGGGLDIDTTSGKGIDATGIGVGVPRNILNITGSGNTIDTVTGRALEVVNTDIGATDLTFERISSNGAVNGIRLDATGSAGGLIVTGNGTANSGGTIQSSTGPGILLANVGGGVDLTRVRVMNGGDDGIRGTTVAGFSLDNGAVTGNGNAVGESGFDFTGLTGTVALTDVTATGNADNNLSITNDSGTLNLGVTRGSYGSNSTTIGNDGILLLATGTGSLTANIANATFTDHRGDHIQMATDASNTATLSLTVDNNTLTTTGGADPSVLGGGITVNPGGNSNSDVIITNNNIQEAFSSAITVDTPGSASDGQPATIDLTITGNTIGTALGLDSGSESGNGISISSNGLADIDAVVDNNTIRQYANAAGIDILQNDGNGTLDVTARNNTIANPGTFASNGILVRSGLSGGTETGQTCLDLGHPSTAGLKNSITGSGAIPSTDIRVRHQSNTTVRLAGYGGSAYDIAAVAAYLQARNDGNGTPTASATTSGTGAGFIAAASCTLP